MDIGSETISVQGNAMSDEMPLGGPYDQAMFDRDAAAMLGQMQQFREAFDEFAKSDREESYDSVARDMTDWPGEFIAEAIEDIQVLIEDIVALIGRIREAAAGGKGEAEARLMVSRVNQLQAELAWLESLLEKLEAAVDARIAEDPAAHGKGNTFVAKVKQRLTWQRRFLGNRVQPILKRLLRLLWRFISGLLTPKEWTLGGKLGTGFLGLAEAHLDITFGPTQKGSS